MKVINLKMFVGLSALGTAYAFDCENLDGQTAACDAAAACQCSMNGAYCDCNCFMPNQSDDDSCPFPPTETQQQTEPTEDLGHHQHHHSPNQVDECDPDTCEHSNCNKWCQCFDEKKEYPKCDDEQDTCRCGEGEENEILAEGTSIGCYRWDKDKQDSQGQYMFHDLNGHSDEKINSYFGITEWPQTNLGENIWNAIGWDYDMCLKEAIWKEAYYFGMGVDASMANGMNNIGSSNCMIFTNNAITPNPFSAAENNQFSEESCCHNRVNGKCIGGSNAFVLYATGLGSTLNQPDHVVDVWEEICPTGNCGRNGEI